MSEPLAPTPIPEETLAYQPISGWAVAGLGLGIVVSLAVVVSAIVGLFQGAPVFFPMWSFGLPLLGMVLAMVGLRHVQTSEGTRAGASLARAGLWFNLLSGLCYFSYYWFTGLAVQNQANNFLMEAGEDAGFFPLLREAAAVQVRERIDYPTQLNAAFLLTLPATSRNARSKDEVEMQKYYDAPAKEGMGGDLSNFRESVFARVLFKGMAKDAEITPLAVHEWLYEKRSYVVRRSYRIKTREVELEAVMTVQSTEADAAGQSRKWFINLMKTYVAPGSRQYTPFGQGLQVLRWQAKEALEQRVKSLNGGESFKDFKERDQTVWSLALMLVPEKKDLYQNAVTNAFAGSASHRLSDFRVYYTTDNPSKAEQAGDKVRVYNSFRFTLPAAETGTPGGFVHGYAVLETRQAIDPAQFNSDSHPPEWDVVRVVVTQVVPPREAKAAVPAR